MLKGAMCVQKFNDSRVSAIHITYRNSLRSSSMREPRDPLLKVLNYLLVCSEDTKEIQEFWVSGGRLIRARGRRGGSAEATIGMFTGVWEL